MKFSFDCPQKSSFVMRNSKNQLIQFIIKNQGFSISRLEMLKLAALITTTVGLVSLVYLNQDYLKDDTKVDILTAKLEESVSEHFWCILSTIAGLIFVLSILKGRADQKVAERKRAYLSVRRISVEEYEKNRKINTERALNELFDSEAYKKYYAEKQNGRYANITLDDDDRIELSDDSEVPETTQFRKTR